MPSPDCAEIHTRKILPSLSLSNLGLKSATAEVIDLERELVPLLPLRDVVVFPHTVMPLFIGRKSSVNAITQAMKWHHCMWKNHHIS
jgi:hypothetical protein